MRCHPLTRSAAVTVTALLITASANAQVAEPEVDPAGTLLFYPSLEVLLGLGDTDADSVGFVFPVRYSATDELSVGGGARILFGDYGAFGLGGGAKFQLLEDGRGDPIDLSLGGSIGLDFGEIDVDVPGRRDAEVDLNVYQFLLAPHAGKTIEAGSGIAVNPYGGLLLGFTIADPDVGDGDTEGAFGLVLGCDVDLSRQWAVSSEMEIGFTDGLPDFNWFIGATWRILGSTAELAKPAYESDAWQNDGNVY